MKQIASTIILASSLLSLSSATSIRGADDNNEDTRNQRDLKKDTRIIGGDGAVEGRYSYAVSLQDDLGLFCGGSLIARDVVLTAAHCAGGNYNVVIGRHEWDGRNGESIAVKKEIKHPLYDDWITDNDFNLVFLQQPTELDVALVKLNSDSNVPRVGDAVTAMGWGDTIASDDEQELSDVLMHVEVNVISNTVCEQSQGYIGRWFDSYDGYITDNMLCARANNADSCQGDSGGPLVVLGNDSNGADDALVGVVSWGIGCATESFPGVYARVSEAYDWIQEEVCKRSKFPPPSLCGVSETITTDPTLSVGQFFAPLDKIDSVSGTTNNKSWEILLSEDFSGGYGFFKSGGDDTSHYYSVKGRDGVVRLQNGNGEASSIYSRKINVNKEYSAVKVIFSFMALKFKDDDSFCLDYNINESDWKQEQCWNSRDDFDANSWYDGMSVEFDASSADSLRFRFRCAADRDRDGLLVDNVEIEGLNEPI